MPQERNLIYASCYEYEKVVQILLMHDAKVDVINKYGYSALWYAEENGNQKIIELLKDSGAKPLF